MSKKIHTEAVDSLFDAILCLKDREECYTFFEDVCTINEILSLSQRFEVAKMLKDKRTYLEMTDTKWYLSEWQKKQKNKNRKEKVRRGPFKNKNVYLSIFLRFLQFIISYCSYFSYLWAGYLPYRL